MWRIKLLRYSAVLFLIGAVACILFLTWKRTYYQQKEQKILIKNTDREARYTKIPYLEIPSLSLKKVIEPYLNIENLNHYAIGIWNEAKEIKKINHLVLAGHNVKNAFGSLYKIKEGEELYIYYEDQKDIYVITDIKIIGVTEMQYLKDIGNKELSLITCVGDDQKRLWVHAKQKEP